MTALRDCTDPAAWEPHVEEAAKTLTDGGLVVFPTDTVYGIAADAFKPEAVQALLDAKGRGRQMPPPVLIGNLATLDGLADAVPEAVREMVAKHWPGPLTVILQAQPSLQWDLGETHGTVALRMPDHELALAVLRATGPLAVSSANSTGSPAATTAAAAQEMLGESVQIYLDGGASPGGVASTIVDATGEQLRIVREGALSAADLGIVEPEPTPEPEQEPAAEPEPEREPGKPEAITTADDVVIAPRRVRRKSTKKKTAVPVVEGVDVEIAPRRVRKKVEEAAVEEVPAEEAPAEDAAVEEAPAEEAPAEDAAVEEPNAPAEGPAETPQP